jgi:uncharacterized repeat protein (TIGR03803 family)
MKAFTNFDAAPRGSVRGRMTAACLMSSSFVLVLSATAVPAAASTPVYKVLHSFQLADGVDPFNSVTKDSQGNLIGTALTAGPNGAGTVYKLTPKGAFSVLYGFSASGTDAQYPVSDPRLVKDSSGNFYGTASGGGQSNNGAIFKVAPDGTETVLYSFTGGNDGGSPNGGVLLDGKLDIYGTTTSGGIYGGGTFYELTANGTFKVIYAFGAGSDGQDPQAGLYKDPKGNYWGTTAVGGASGNGTVFKITSKGVESVVYSFTAGNDGYIPESTLIADKQGNLYGTTHYGGVYGGGTVFKITPSGAETTLYSFTGGSDGYTPVGGVVMDTSGNLYGQTFGQGSTNTTCPAPGQCGSVYEITPAGTEITLHDFAAGSDGDSPEEGLLLSGSYLYGTTQSGGGTGCGGYGCGTVFEVPK